MHCSNCCCYSILVGACEQCCGLLLAAFLLRERISPSRLAGALVIVAGLGVVGGQSIAPIGLDGVQGDFVSFIGAKTLRFRINTN